MFSQWYIHKDGQQSGPYSFEQLAGEVQAGWVAASDMVWSAGMEGWARVDQVEGLNPIAQQHPGMIQSQQHAATAYHNTQPRELKLEQLSKWMGFVGIVTIIGGVLSAISGVFAFVVGAIPGIITIILGVKLSQAKKNADAILFENAVDMYSANFSMFIANLNSYFKIMGILIIIGFVLGILGIIFSLIAGAAFMNYFSTLDLF